MEDSDKQKNGHSTYTTALIIVTSLFFMWGFITVLVDALIPRLRDVFELTYFQAGMVQFAFFTAYAVISIPGGYLISKVGYKWGVVIGLLTMGFACVLFYPAAGLRVFTLFLLALFILAGGITILQVAANPYVAALGPAKFASSRLNLSQAFNSLGTTLAPLVSAAFILDAAVMSSAQISVMPAPERDLYMAGEAAAVQGPFLILAAVLVLLAIVFALFRMPSILETDHDKSGNYRDAVKYRHLMLGALAIFVYVGAEVTIGSYLVNYFLNMDARSFILGSGIMSSIAATITGGDIIEMTPSRLVGTFVFFYWGGAMFGRFLGSYLLRFIKPGNLLATYGMINVVLLTVAIISSGGVAFWSILSIGLFNSIMFPTIFTLAIHGMGQYTAQGSGILCTAIVGGAIIPPLYGALADITGLQLAFILPIFCYLYIVYYGRIGSKPYVIGAAAQPA
jgi:MFS transporter, FHS family, L-fucose permease